MNDALNVFVLGVVAGFGLSVLLDMLGAAIGRTMALFDVY